MRGPQSLLLLSVIVLALTSQPVRSFADPCPTCHGTGEAPPGGAAPAAPGAPSPADAQKALEEQRQREQEQARLRQAEFERAKQEALSMMKGTAENELGLKGVTTGDALGLKGLEAPGSGDLGLKGLGASEPLPPASQVTNPQIARIMRGLDAIPVPPPLSQRDASLSWKPLSLTSDSAQAELDTAADVTLLA